MGIITGAVVGSICKDLVKLLVRHATDSKVAETIAGELAGAGGKDIFEKVIHRLVAANLGPVEDHPEFQHLSENDREAVRLEVLDSIKPALDRSFLGSVPYNLAQTVEALTRKRGHNGSPVGFSADAVSFYRQSLDASVRSIIRVAESAPEWHASNATEIHAKLRHLVDRLADEAKNQAQILSVLEYMKRSIEDVRTKEFEDRRAFLTVYYRAIRNSLDKMELYGLDVQEENPARSQRLSVAYISLNLTATNPGKDEGSRSWESVLDTLEPGTEGRLLVRGDAGMGKTTLLRWAAIALASPYLRLTQSSSIFVSYLEETTWRNFGNTLRSDTVSIIQESFFRDLKPTVSWRSKVPLLVILRDCPEGRFPDLDWFPSFVNSAVGTPPAGFVRWLLDNGKALVMIDGLDEVPVGEPTKRTSKGITDLLEAYGERGNLFIATSRPLVKDPSWIEQLNFREAVIAPMTDAERDQLIRKWHGAVAAQTSNAARRTEIESMPERLIQQLNGRPAIARLATVPLLCAMICAQIGPLGTKLPESEFAIIHKMAEAMLWVRDRDRDVPKTGTPWDDLKEDKRLAVAARLAHFIVSQGRAAIPREAALQKIGDALRFVGFSAFDANRDALAILHRMGDRGGVVRAPEGGLVEFSHKTFCEFFSAFQFVEDQDTLFLSEHAPEPGPSNVCRYTAGVKNRKYTEDLIRRVLDFKDNPEARGVIALRMKLAAPSLDPEVQERIKSVEDQLIPPRSPMAAKAIGELGEEIVPRLAFVPGMQVEQQIMNATALVEMRTDCATAALAAYAPGARSSTLVELLCRVMNPLLIPYVRRALTSSRDDDAFGWHHHIQRQIDSAAIREWLAADSDLAAVTALNLRHTEVTDEGLAALVDKHSGLTSLTTLSLTATPITDAGLSILAKQDSGLQGLTALDLSGTIVTDAGVAALANEHSGLKALNTLNLDGTNVSDAGLMTLAKKNSGLQALTTLHVGGTNITDAGLSILAKQDSGLQGLTALDLNSTNVTDAGVAALAEEHSGLKALVTLDFGNTNLTDAGLTTLAHAGLQALTTLNLEGTLVTNAGLAALADTNSGLNALKTLYLRATDITDAILTALAHKDSALGALTTLDLSDTKVTDGGLAAMAAKDSGLKLLTTLYLGGTQVTDAGVAALVDKDSGLKTLTALDLGDTDITDASLVALADKNSGLSALTMLDLGGTAITDAGLAALADTDSGLGALATLDLGGAGFTAEGVDAILRARPSLKVRTKNRRFLRFQET